MFNNIKFSDLSTLTQIATIASGIAAIVGVILGTITWSKSSIESKKKPREYYIITKSTQSVSEAKRSAQLLRGKGIDAKIYLSQNGYYAISVGLYSGDKVVNVKNDAIKKGIINKDSYIVLKSTLTFQEQLNKDLDIKKNKIYSVVVNSNKSLLDARKLANFFERKGYNAEIWSSPNGYYAVIIGSGTYENALNLRIEAIKRGAIGEDSYLLPKDIFLKKFEFERQDGSKFIQVGAFVRMDGAFKRAEKLLKHKYDAQIFLSSNGMYSVALGPYPEEVARKIRFKTIDIGHIGDDSYIIDGSSFLHPLKKEMLQN